jgi:hypothetical protein
MFRFREATRQWAGAVAAVPAGIIHNTGVFPVLAPVDISATE